MRHILLLFALTFLLAPPALSQDLMNVQFEFNDGTVTQVQVTSEEEWAQTVRSFLQDPRDGALTILEQGSSEPARIVKKGESVQLLLDGLDMDMTREEALEVLGDLSPMESPRTPETKDPY